MLKNLSVVALLTASLMMTLPAIAQTSASGDVPVAKLSWEPPVTRVSGEALDPATDLANYNLICENIDTNSVVNRSIPAVTDIEPYTIKKSNLFPEYGDYFCKLTATDNEGLTSEPSNAVEIAYYKQPPSAPTNLIIIVE